MRRTLDQAICCTAAMLVLAACTGDGSADRAARHATRADSAGIEIVTNDAPAWQDGDEWRIDPVPALEIGSREDEDPRYDLVRATSGAVLPDSSIVVMLAGSSEIRVFDASGAWSRTIGRMGSGPGEMQGATALQHVLGTLYVSDAMLRRVSAFGVDGSFLTSWPWPVGEGGASIRPAYRLAKGEWFAVTGTALSRPGALPETDVITRIPETYVRLSADFTDVLDTVAIAPGAERMVRTTTGPGGALSSIEIVTPLISRSSLWAAGNDALAWGDNAHAEVHVYGIDSSQKRLLRWNAPVVAITSEYLDRMKQEALARAGTNEQARTRIETRYASGLIGATEAPAFASLHWDALDNLWVREYAPLVADSVKFRVFDPSGQYLGTMSLPPRHTVLEIGREHVLTVWQDEDDIEHLRVYRLSR